MVTSNNNQIGPNNIINQSFNYIFGDESNIAIPRFISNMPFVNEFEGRWYELVKVSGLLKTEKKLIAISGVRGIGKTAFAKKVVLDAQNLAEYAHLIYIEIKTNLTDTIANDLNLISNLKLTATVSQIPMNIPNRNEKIFQLILNRLKNIKENSLIVIDNSIDGDPRDLLLLSSLNWQKLVSSHVKIDFAKEFQLYQANDADAIRIFKAYFDKDNYTPEENSLLTIITNRLGNHCLAIELVAKNAKELDWTIERIAEELAKEGLEIRNFSEGVSVHHADDDEVKDMFGYLLELFDPFQETADKQTLLLYFSLCPNVWTNKEQWALLCERSIDELAESLNVLYRRAWLSKQEQSDGKQYQMHQLLAELLREKFRKRHIWKQTDGFIEKIEGIYKNEIAGKRKNSEFLLELANETVKHLSTQITFKLAFQIFEFEFDKGNLSAGFDTATQMKRIAQILSEKNKLAIAYSKLAETERQRGNFENSLVFYKSSTDLIAAQHLLDPSNINHTNNLAISYLKLGDTENDLGNPPKALERFEIGYKLLSELLRAHPLDPRFKRDLAISYEKIGELKQRSGEHPIALSNFEKRKRLAQELHECDPCDINFKNGLAVSYSKLGEIHSAMENFTVALENFKKRSQLASELHEKFPHNVWLKSGLATSYCKLGLTYIELKEKGLAFEYFKKAESVYLELIIQSPEDFQYGIDLNNIRKYLDTLE